MKIRALLLYFLVASAGLPMVTPKGFGAEKIDSFKVDPEDSAAMQRAIRAARRHDFAAAEDELTARSQHLNGSAADHLELTHRLVALATAMAREADPGSANALAKAALGHAAQAYTAASSKKEQAQAKARSGWIYERLQGDIPTAIESYRIAAKADPDDKEIARELMRLVSMDRNLRAKLEHARKTHP